MLGITCFISQIIGPSTEGVDGTDAFKHAGWHVPGKDTEILTMRQCQLTAIAIRLVNGDGGSLIGPPHLEQLDNRNACRSLH